MQSFQDLSKTKCENEDKINKETEMLQSCQNPGRTKRKYACSKKMMQTRLKPNSRDSNVDYSLKFNVNELSNFSIGEAKDSKYLNKSFDLVNEHKLETEADNNNNNVDNSFYATSYFDLGKRESSFCSNNNPRISFNNVDLNVNYNRNSNLNGNFNTNDNNDKRDSKIASVENHRMVFDGDDHNNNNKNNIVEEKNSNKNVINNSGKNRDYRSRHYEEIKKSENFIDFLNYKIENFQKEMMDYLTTAKIDLEKAYKKFNEKVIKISTDKARRISQVYRTSDCKAGLLFSQVSYLNGNQIQNNSIVNAFSAQQSAESPSFSESNSPLKTQNSNFNPANSTIKNNNYNNNTPITNRTDFPLISNNSSENLNLESLSESGSSALNDLPKNKSFTYKKQQSNTSAFGDQKLLASKEIENLKNFANKYITERIDTMFELHENLRDSIKQNLSLLTNFLNDYDFNCLNPMQEFINLNADEICNSWVLPKMKFEKLNLNCILKNNKIPKIFRNYLINEDSENKFNKYKIEKSTSYELDKRILKQNSLFLEKLVLQKLNSVSELEKVFASEETKILNFEKIKKIKFSKSSLDYLANLSAFRNTQKLEAKKSFFTNEIPQGLFEKNFANLTKISFRKCNLDNSSVTILMSEFEKLKNLEEINLSHNLITQFNFRGDANFNSLHTLILRKNKISKFYLKNKNLYPQLKIVDFSYNNIVELTQVKELAEDNNVMVLISRNLGLYNCREAYKAYLNSLKQIMLQTEIKLRKLDLSYLYYLFSNREEFHFKNLCLNKILLFSVKKLDLSFNNLCDEDLAEFFKSNRGFVNIKEISLKNNRLTESFFELLIDLELNDLYEYLENLDLASNSVSYNCLDALLKAFQDNSNLKQIVLKNNPVENYFYSFFCRRLENKQRSERFFGFFNCLEKLRIEKRNCAIVLNYNSDLFQYFSNEAKEISSKFIKFEK